MSRCTRTSQLRADFAPLLPAEFRLLDALKSSTTATISQAPVAVSDEFVDHDWSRTELRGTLIRAIVTAAEQVFSDPPRLTIQGASIIDTMDLSLLDVAEMSLTIENSRIEQELNLDDLRIGKLQFDGSETHGLRFARGWAEVLSLQRGVVNGETRLNAADIGHLDFGNARLNNPGKLALQASVLHTRRSARFKGLGVRGRLIFIGADIGGQLILRDVDIDGRSTSGKSALSLHEATVARSLYLREANIEGKCNLSGMRVGGRLDAKDSNFTNDDVCLDMQGSTIGRSVQFDNATFGGRLKMSYVTVGSYLAFRSVELLPSDNQYRSENSSRKKTDSEVLIEDEDEALDLTSQGANLDLAHAQIGGTLVFTPTTAKDSVVNLSHASIDRLLDTPTSWSSAVPLLAGLSYEWIPFEDHGWSLKERLAWIDRQSDFSVQPYEELSRLLLARGRAAPARRSLYRRDVAVAKRLSLGQRIVSNLFRYTVGFGYQLWLSLVWLTFVLIIGGFLWDVAKTENALTVAGHGGATCPPSAQCFNAWMMSLDVTLPVIEFGQATEWSVIGGGTTPMWPHWLHWFQTGFGWAITTAVVAGFGRLLSRQ